MNAESPQVEFDHLVRQYRRGRYTIREALEAAYSAGAERAAQIVRQNSYHGHAGLFACSTDLPCKTCELAEQILAVGESSRAPEGTKP